MAVSIIGTLPSFEQATQFFGQSEMFFTQLHLKEMLVLSLVLLLLLQDNPVVSFSYDCENNNASGGGGGGGTEQDLSVKKGEEVLLPCAFKDVQIPADYNAKVSPETPDMEFGVRIEKVKFMEDTGESNITIFVVYYWTDSRIRIAKNRTSNIWLNPPSLLKYFWSPTPNIEYFSTEARNFGSKDGIFEKPKERGSAVLMPRDSDTDNTTNVARFGAYVLQHFIIGSENSYLYYPYDKHEFVLNFRSGFDVEGDSSKITFKKQHLWDPSFEIATNASDSPKAGQFFGAPDEGRDECLGLVILLTRKLHIHVIRTYIPSGLFVVLCWLSMFVAVELATERVALCTATLLTITMFFNTISDSGPDASYMRAVDMWLLAATSFVFLILIENIVVMKLMGKHTKSANTKREEDTCRRLVKIFEKILQLQLAAAMANKSNGTVGTEEPAGGIEDDGNHHTILMSKNNLAQDGTKEEVESHTDGESNNHRGRKKFVAAKRMDQTSIILITAAILLFNGIYWVRLTGTEQTKCEQDSSCPLD